MSSLSTETVANTLFPTAQPPPASISTLSVPVGLNQTEGEPAEASLITPEPSQAAPAADPEQDRATIQQMIDGYWAAFNNYDADHALTMLEASYRAEEEELIRSDIGRMKLFRVKLGVSEETPLTLNDGGDYETYLKVKTPVDSRRLLMIFRQIGGQWRIVFSDEVD